jgi:hypothetical protein
MGHAGSSSQVVAVGHLLVTFWSRPRRALAIFGERLRTTKTVRTTKSVLSRCPRRFYRVSALSFLTRDLRCWRRLLAIPCIPRLDTTPNGAHLDKRLKLTIEAFEALL